uniref:CCHC-type domain-containing protein n=1 Tax=Setaria italica TaxID=4555 RepID=K3Y104_SETIT
RVELGINSTTPPAPASASSSPSTSAPLVPHQPPSPPLQPNPNPNPKQPKLGEGDRTNEQNAKRQHGKGNFEQEGSLHSANKEVFDTEIAENSGRREYQLKKEEERKVAEVKINLGICGKCGKTGHKAEDCFKPVIYPRCKKEGHLPRVCPEIMPWECIAPFCGFAALGQGFHIIQDDDYGDTAKDTANFALITITQGEATTRQVEGEFKAKAGSDNKFQMKLPSASKVEDLSFFTGMQMRIVPRVSFRVEYWNPYASAKAELSTAWFRIFRIPTERRTEKRVCYVGSLVGIPLEVDKTNLKSWEYVRVKIGCKNVIKVLAMSAVGTSNQQQGKQHAGGRESNEQIDIESDGKTTEPDTRKNKLDMPADPKTNCCHEDKERESSEEEIIEAKFAKSAGKETEGSGSLNKGESSQKTYL